MDPAAGHLERAALRGHRGNPALITSGREQVVIQLLSTVDMDRSHYADIYRQQLEHRLHGLLSGLCRNGDQTWYDAMRQMQVSPLEFYCQHEAQIDTAHAEIYRGIKSVYSDAPESALRRPSSYTLLCQVYSLVFDQPLESIS